MDWLTDRCNNTNDDAELGGKSTLVRNFTTSTDSYKGCEEASHLEAMSAVDLGHDPERVVVQRQSGGWSYRLLTAWIPQRC